MALSSLCSASAGTTIAVEDNDSAAPSASAAAGFSPASAAAPPISAAETTSWARPRPNTSFLTLFRRSKDSSSPIVNISAATPISAMLSIASTLVMSSQPSHLVAAGEAAEPKGPERDAREQVAEHRAHPDVEEQRRHDAGRHQEQQRLAVDSKVDGRIQSSLIGGAKAATVAEGVGLGCRGQRPRLQSRVGGSQLDEKLVPALKVKSSSQTAS